jgi:hypothetical protein
MIKKLGRKLKSKKGESLAETLVALLISTMALMILAGALVAASKVNYKVEKTDTFMAYQTADGASNSTSELEASDIVIKTSDAGAPISISELDKTSVKVHKDEYTVGEEKMYYYFWIPTITEDSGVNQNSGG